MDVNFPECDNWGMENEPTSPLATRLKSRMDRLQMNAYQLATVAGFGESFVRDILRGKSKNPSAEKLSKLAMVLGTTLQWLTTGHEPDSELAQETSGLEVLGDIQAGNWMDLSLLGSSPDYGTIPIARDPRFPNAKQYALRVRGDSMNLRYPEMSYVICVEFIGSGLKMKMGHVVHVERHNGSLVEVTLKEVTTMNGKIVLSPQSTNPNHKPIILDGDAGTEISIRGVVIGRYQKEEI